MLENWKLNGALLVPTLPTAMFWLVLLPAVPPCVHTAAPGNVDPARPGGATKPPRLNCVTSGNEPATPLAAVVNTVRRRVPMLPPIDCSGIVNAPIGSVVVESTEA